MEAQEEWARRDAARRDAAAALLAEAKPGKGKGRQLPQGLVVKRKKEKKEKKDKKDKKEKKDKKDKSKDDVGAPSAKRARR